MEAYEIDASTLHWAERKNKAIRRALTETPTAATCLKRAAQAMKRASDCCKAHPESDVMASIADEIERLHSTLSQFSREWADDVDAIWLGVMNYQKQKEGAGDDIRTGS